MPTICRITGEENDALTILIDKFSDNGRQRRAYSRVGSV
jgi:hypothetical protein